MSKEQPATREQLKAMKASAVTMLRRFGRDDDADRFEAMSDSEYAEHKNLTLTNPAPKSTTKSVKGSKKKMSMNLKEQLVDIENENDDLDDDLQDVLEVADEAWNCFVKCDETMSKEQLLDAIEAACEAFNEYDEVRFPIDEEDDSPEANESDDVAA